MAIKVTPPAPMGKPSPKASPNPAKATSPANVKAVFGVPKKQR